MSVFRNAIAGALSTIRSVAGVAVTLRRGEVSSSITVVWGKTDADFENFDGTFQAKRSRDALIRQVDYVLGGSVATPQAGDRIEETNGGKTYLYEVQPFAGQSPSRESDPYYVTFRIHTKLIGVVDPTSENPLRSVADIPPRVDQPYDSQHVAGDLDTHE